MEGEENNDSNGGEGEYRVPMALEQPAGRDYWSFGMADEPLKAGWKMAAVRFSTLVSAVRQVPD